MTYLKFNNGVEIPQLGLGVFQSEPGNETQDACRYALEVGYRHIDTAQAYRNEESVGQAIKESGVKREDIFITTKVWNEHQRNNTVKESIEESLNKLETDYIDLLLIHWPVKGRYVDTWLQLEEAFKNGGGKIRAIGVSNFLEHHIEDIKKVWSVAPVINQYELHPEFNQRALSEFCKAENIVVQAYSPLGGSRNVERMMKNPVLVDIANKYGKTPAQAILRWNIELGYVTIPKSVKPARIKSNFEIFDFELTAEDVAAINALDKGTRLSADPDNFNF